MCKHSCDFLHIKLGDVINIQMYGESKISVGSTYLTFSSPLLYLKGASP